MNYRLMQQNFINILQEKGIIENNGNGLIELAITDGEPVKDSPDNIILARNDKYAYVLQGGEKIYGRAVTYIVNDINVSTFDVKIPKVDCYTKKESDKKFATIESLKNIPSENVKFSDGESFQAKLDKGELNGKSVIDLVKENGFKGTQNDYLYTLRGQDANVPLIPKITNEDNVLKCSYSANTTIQTRHIKSYTSKTHSDRIAKIEKLIIDNISEGDALRVEVVTFFGVDNTGKVRGTSNPGRRPGIVPSGTFPYLGVLDPTLEVTYPIKNGTCSLDVNIEYDKFIKKDLSDLTSRIDSILDIPFVEFEFKVMKSGSVIDTLRVRHFFDKTVDNTPKEILNLKEILPIKKFVYCTESEYDLMEKTVDNTIIYLVRNEETGIITIKVYVEQH